MRSLSSSTPEGAWRYAHLSIPYQFASQWPCRLLTSIRDGDILTRVGGDEFLVLLPASDERGARRILRRVAANTRSWRVTEYSLEPAMSAGWVVSSDGPETVVDRADERMYAMKRRRSRLRVRRRHAALPPVRLARRATDRH